MNIKSLPIKVMATATLLSVSAVPIAQSTNPVQHVAHGAEAKVTDKVSIDEGAKDPNWKKLLNMGDKVDGKDAENIRYDDSKVDLGKEGKYDLVVTGQDKDGEELKQTIPVTVNKASEDKKDVPEINKDAKDIDWANKLNVGDEINGKKVSNVQIDESNVDTSKPGTYQVYTSGITDEGESVVGTYDVKVINEPADESEPEDSAQANDNKDDAKDDDNAKADDNKNDANDEGESDNVDIVPNDIKDDDKAKDDAKADEKSDDSKSDDAKADEKSDGSKSDEKSDDAKADEKSDDSKADEKSDDAKADDEGESAGLDIVPDDEKDKSDDSKSDEEQSDDAKADEKSDDAKADEESEGKPEADVSNDEQAEGNDDQDSEASGSDVSKPKPVPSQSTPEQTSPQPETPQNPENPEQPQNQGQGENPQELPDTGSEMNNNAIAGGIAMMASALLGIASYLFINRKKKSNQE